MTNSSEKKWVVWFAVLVMTVTAIPYFIGYLRQGDNWHFTGFFFGVEDGNSYIAKMLTGSYGSWLFRTPYTAYPQNGFLAFLPYILLGKLAGQVGLHDQLVYLFQLFRWIAGILEIYVVYDFLSMFIQEIRYRKLGTALVTLGGGLGWLALVGLQGLWNDRLPLDFYSPESFGFLAIYGLPHLILARALLLWGLKRYLNPVQTTSKIRYLLTNSIWWLLLGLLQPLTIVTGWGILAIHLLIEAVVVIWKNKKKLTGDWSQWLIFFKRALLLVLFSLPLVVYNVVAFSVDPFLKIWSQQNTIFSPPPFDYLMGYILVLPFVVLGGWFIVRERARNHYFLLGWVIIFLFLAYIPFNMQRRLPEGIWVALVILAVMGVERLSSRIRKEAHIVLSLSFISSFILLLGGVIAVWNPGVPIYRPKSEVDIFKYLAKYASPGQIVLAPYDMSNVLPAWAPLRTLIGLGPESARLKELLPRVEAFYNSEETTEEQDALFQEFHVDYIFVDLQAKYRPENSQDRKFSFKLIDSNENYELYQVGQAVGVK